jgi:hypothetical protein
MSGVRGLAMPSETRACFIVVEKSAPAPDVPLD